MPPPRSLSAITPERLGGAHPDDRVAIEFPRGCSRAEAATLLLRWARSAHRVGTGAGAGATAGATRTHHRALQGPT